MMLKYHTQLCEDELQKKSHGPSSRCFFQSVREHWTRSEINYPDGFQWIDSFRSQWSGQVRPGRIRPDQIRSDQIKSDQVRSDQIRSNRSDQIKSDEVRSDQIGSDQKRSDRIRSDRIRSDQITCPFDGLHTCLGCRVTVDWFSPFSGCRWSVPGGSCVTGPYTPVSRTGSVWKSSRTNIAYRQTLDL